MASATYHLNIGALISPSFAPGLLLSRRSFRIRQRMREVTKGARVHLTGPLYVREP